MNARNMILVAFGLLTAVLAGVMLIDVLLAMAALESAAPRMM